MMWYPKGVKAFVRSRAVAGGLIYIGLPGAPLRMMKASSIDPTLPIADPAPGAFLERPGTATRYEDFSPGQRAIYLEWLDTGRSNPLYDDQYVYTYLFGLDYRIGSLRAELDKDGADLKVARLIFEREGPVLRDELLRLSQSYSDRPVLKANIDSVLSRLNRALDAPELVPADPTANELTAKRIAKVQFDIAEAPRPPAQRWYRKGEQLDVRGREITTGLIYAGSPDPLIDAREPSAIDPAFPGGLGVPTYERSLPLTDLYLRIHDLNLYIDWHAEGRQIVMAESWMVELFLWGLERRVMFEGWHFGIREAWTDLPDIEDCLVDMTHHAGRRRAEPEWLGLAAGLLRMTRILRVLTGQISPETLESDPARFKPSHRAAIFDLRGEAWSEELAFTLLQEGHKPTPDFFRAHAPLARHLFRLYYEPSVHGRCMARAGTEEIAFSYTAASPALRQVDKFGFPNLTEPDLKGDRMLPVLDVLRQIQSKHAVAVQEIVGESASELGMTWHFLLPAEQRSIELSAALHRFASGIALEMPNSMLLAGLMAHLGCNVPRKSHHLLRCFVDALDQAGVALEPDPCESGELPARAMLVTPFRCASGSSRPLSPSGVLYGLAASVIDWIAIKLDVALDAKTVIASKCLDSLQDISDCDRARLKIQLRTGKHLAPRKGAENFAAISAELQESHRTFIENGFEALVGVQHLDRRTADRRLKPLYTSGLLRVTPPTVPKPVARPRRKLVLDKGKIQGIIEDTEKASRILAPIFGAVDGPEPLGTPSSTHPWNLDEHHAAFLVEMAALAPLNLEAARAIALRYDLMFDGAVERINEAAIEHAGEAIFDVDADRVERTGVEAPT